MKKIMVLLIMLFVTILLSYSVNAQVGQECSFFANYLYEDNIVAFDGSTEHIYSSYSTITNTEIITPTDSFVIGDFFPSNDGLEIVMITGNNQIWVLDATNDTAFDADGALIYNETFSGAYLSGYTSYDLNGDGYLEFVVVNTSASSSELWVMSVGETDITINHTISITHEAYNKFPTCYEDWCYVVDDESVMFKLSMRNSTKTGIAIGNADDGGNNYVNYVTIDECDNTGGVDIVTYGYFLTGNFDSEDVRLITYSNFSLEKSYDTHSTNPCDAPTALNIRSKNPLMCGQLDDGFNYIAFGGGGTCYDSSFGGRQRNSMVYRLFDENLTVKHSWKTDDVWYSSSAVHSFTELLGYTDIDGDNNTDFVFVFYHYGYNNNVYDMWIIYSNSTNGLINLLVGATAPFVTAPSMAYGRIADYNNDSVDDLFLSSGEVYNKAGSLLGTWKSVTDYQKGMFAQSGDSMMDIFYLRSGALYSYTDGLTDSDCSFVGGDSMPFVSAVTPSSNPATANTTVTWTVTISDDSPSGEIRSAFDCENDGTLEYGWGYRGTTPNFNCVYSSSGSKTAKAWASDDVHYPTNASAYGYVTITAPTESPNPIPRAWVDVGANNLHTYTSGGIADIDDITYNLYNYSISNLWMQVVNYSDSDYGVDYNQEVMVGDIDSTNTGYEIVILSDTKVYMLSANLSLIDEYTINDTSTGGVASQHILFDFDYDGYLDIIFIETINSMVFGDEEYLTVLNGDTGTLTPYAQYNSGRRMRNKVPACDLFGSDRMCFTKTEDGLLWGVDNAGFQSLTSIASHSTTDDDRYNVITVDDINSDSIKDLMGWSYDSSGNPVLWAVRGDTLATIAFAGLNTFIPSPYRTGCRFTSPLQSSYLEAINADGIVFSLNCHYGDTTSQREDVFMGVLEPYSSINSLVHIYGTYDGVASSNPINLHISQPIVIDLVSNSFDEVCTVASIDCNGDANTNNCSGTITTGQQFTYLLCKSELSGWNDTTSLFYNVSTTSYYDLGWAVSIANVDNENATSKSDGGYDFIGDTKFLPAGSNYEEELVQDDGWFLGQDLAFIWNVLNHNGRKSVFVQSDYADFAWADDNYLWLYTDSLEVYNATNQVPTILIHVPTPDPQQVSVAVTWHVTLSDPDSFPAELKSAFDCENDGVLEYAWANRGATPTFSCTYSSSGLKSSKAWASDNFNYPVNTSSTATVTITTAPPTGAGCSGYVAPACTGSCYFYDDFNHNYSIECNEWEGTNRTPVGNKLYVYDMETGEYITLDKRSEPIEDWEYEGFSFQFNFIQNNSQRTYFQIYDMDVAKTVIYLYWENGQLYSLDSVSPYVTVLGAYNLSTEYLISGAVSFTDQSVYYTYRGSTFTVELSDSDVSSAGYFVFDWLYNSQVDWKIDDFLVTYGAVAVNGTAPISVIDYPYTPELFCAINWTSRSLSVANCQARGYSTQPQWIGLCPVRACVSDGFSYLYNRAISNIFRTLIIIIIIILLAPLAIALLKSRLQR